MLSITEVLEKSDLTLHTFQSWRRNGSNLLPKPVAVDKRVIYFDDSILERIRFIRDQQAVGKTLAQIAEMISEQLAEEAKALPSWEVMQADQDDYQDEVKALREKWEKGQCQAEVCAVLKLDPALSGQPTTFCLPALGKQPGGLVVYATIISNSLVHFAELYVALYEETEVKQRTEIAVADFGMMLHLIGQEFAERRQLLKMEVISYLLFHGFEGTGATSDFWLETLTVAPIMNQITEASRKYLIRLRDEDIKIP